MNDPCIQTLHYSVGHAEDVDYDKAHPLIHNTPNFTVRIEDGRCEVTMKTHCATVAAAQAEVEPFLRAWELTAALQFRPGDFELAYERATIIDRNPTPAADINAVAVMKIANVSLSATLSAHVGRSKYPDPPPPGLARDAAVELMFERFRRYRARGTTLADMANFCLTTLELTAEGRNGAAQRFMIARTVLNKLGDLAASKGGSEARKAKGAKAEFTAAEREWLEEATKRLILRAAEVVGNPSACLSQITMAHLPPL